MIRLLKNLKPLEWVLGAIAAGLVVLQVWLDLKLPEYMERITALTRTQNAAMGEIWKNGGLMMACAFASLIAAVIVGFISAWIGSGFSRTLRSKMFNHVGTFSMQEVNKFSTPSLITRTTNDIVQIQGVVVFGMQVLFKAPVMAIWAIIKIAGRGFEWSMSVTAAVIVMLVAFTIIGTIVLPKFRQMQTLTDNLTKVARENLTGISVVRAYNADAFQEQKFEKANKKLTKTHLFTGIGFAPLMPMITFIISAMSLSIFWIGAYLINKTGDLEAKFTYFSNMLVFMSYAMQVIMAFMLITMMFIMFPRASVSAKRVNEVLKTASSVQSCERGPISPTADYHDASRGPVIEFKDVSFKYPNAEEDVVKNINFTAGRGETVAIIGGTGSGKSTLINLIPRFFDCTSGEVLIGGINVRDLDLNALRARIGYVPQKAVLFSGSIEDNVAFGADTVDKAKVDEALEIAQAKDFATDALKNNSSSPCAAAAEAVGETDKNTPSLAVARAGSNLSGGQKQRLSIARAIYKNPEIFIFDDSFSALDYKTDRVLRTALRKKLANVCTIIVAQRIGTILDADKILVIENGQIVGVGKHTELLKTCAVYKEIASSQLSAAELKEHTPVSAKTSKKGGAK